MEDESVTLPPEQNVVSPLASTVGSGNGFTVTLVGIDVPVQPFTSVTATE